MSFGSQTKKYESVIQVLEKNNKKWNQGRNTLVPFLLGKTSY